MASRQAALPIAALPGSRVSCAVMGLPLFWFSLRATVISSGNWAWSMVKHCCEQEGWVRALLPSLITCIGVATRPPAPLRGAAQCWGAPGDVPVQLTALGRAEAKGTRGLGQELSPWGGGSSPEGSFALLTGVCFCAQLLPAHGPPAPTHHPTVIVPAPPPSHHVTVVTMGPSSVINTVSTSRQNLDTIVQVGRVCGGVEGGALQGALGTWGVPKPDLRGVSPS